MKREKQLQSLPEASLSWADSASQTPWSWAPAALLSQNQGLRRATVLSNHAGQVEGGGAGARGDSGQMAAGQGTGLEALLQQPPA